MPLSALIYFGSSRHSGPRSFMGKMPMPRGTGFQPVKRESASRPWKPSREEVVPLPPIRYRHEVIPPG